MTRTLSISVAFASGLVASFGLVTTRAKTLDGIERAARSIATPIAADLCGDTRAEYRVQVLGGESATFSA